MDARKKITIEADKSMVYTRVMNEIINVLPLEYDHFEDVFELLEIVEQIDKQLRKR